MPDLLKRIKFRKLKKSVRKSMARGFQFYKIPEAESHELAESAMHRRAKELEYLKDK
jgi:hypothetical protein